MEPALQLIPFLAAQEPSASRGNHLQFSFAEGRKRPPQGFLIEIHGNVDWWCNTGNAWSMMVHSCSSVCGHWAWIWWFHVAWVYLSMLYITPKRPERGHSMDGALCLWFSLAWVGAVRLFCCNHADDTFDLPSWSSSLWRLSVHQNHHRHHPHPWGFLLQSSASIMQSAIMLISGRLYLNKALLCWS